MGEHVPQRDLGAHEGTAGNVANPNEVSWFQYGSMIADSKIISVRQTVRKIPTTADMVAG